MSNQQRGEGSEAPPPESELGEGERIADSLVTGQVVTEPRIEDGRIVIHVLDNVSRRVFVALFEEPGKIVIEAMAGEWTPLPTAEERARAAATAQAYSRAEEALFERLFSELAAAAELEHQRRSHKS